MIFFFIFLYLWLGVSLRLSYIVFAIVSILLLVFIFIKYKKVIGFICIGVFALGVGISFIKFDFKQETYSGLVIDSHPNYFILLSKGEKLYTYSKNNEYEIGDYLSIKGYKKELDFNKVESQFDFADYLTKKGVNYELKATNIETKFSNPIRIKTRRQKFLSHFSEEHQAIIGAIMFSTSGDSEELDNISKLHLSKFANATGLYIYAYLHFIEFILAYFIKNKRIKIISLLTLTPYLIFTFPRLAIIRIFMLEAMKFINEMVLKKKFKYLELLAMSGIAFILLDFHLSYQISFVLGYVTPIFALFINDALAKTKRLKKRAMQSGLFYLYFVPFELKFYNGLNPLTIIFHILLSPIFMLIGVLSLMCFYGIPIYSVVSFFLKGLSNLLHWLNYASFQINGPPFYGWIVLAYIIIFFIYLYYKSIDFIPVYRVAIGVLLGGLVLYFVPIKNFVSEEVSFINVGQGDACLIRKGTTTVMIDTGGLKYMDLGNDSLIPYFEKKRIYNIDMVITTHDDYDHMGALDSLKKNFYVKRVADSDTYFPVSIGGITFYNYNNHVSAERENDSSLVVGFELHHTHYLVMGDAPVSVERNIMKEYEHIDCDILKVGHHGSSTSTCDDFIKYLRPKTAIISCGKNNSYGHPHSSVIDTLKRNNIEIRRTDYEGTITYSNYIFM